jgi:hypothetical protein
MNKTQLLSDTKNLLYFREKSLIMKQCYWYSNDGTLVCRRGRQDHFFMLHFCRQLPIQRYIR